MLWDKLRNTAVGPLGVAVGLGVAGGYGIDQIPTGGGYNAGEYLKVNFYGNTLGIQ